MEIIKPKKEGKESNSLLTPIIYLIMGVILVFMNNQAMKLAFCVVGILVIVYGIKEFILYYNNKGEVRYKNVNLTVSVASIVVGILLIVLSGVLEISIRYLLGFFLIFMGISKLLTQISFGDVTNVGILSNVVLIILGIYSIFISNVVLVVVGWLLIINAIFLFLEYFKK